MSPADPRPSLNLGSMANYSDEADTLLKDQTEMIALSTDVDYGHERKSSKRRQRRIMIVVLLVSLATNLIFMGEKLKSHIEKGLTDLSQNHKCFPLSYCKHGFYSHDETSYRILAPAQAVLKIETRKFNRADVETEWMGASEAVDAAWQNLYACKTSSLLQG